jgi:hypothetical protein
MRWLAPKSTKDPWTMPALSRSTRVIGSFGADCQLEVALRLRGHGGIAKTLTLSLRRALAWCAGRVWRTRLDFGAGAGCDTWHGITSPTTLQLTMSVATGVGCNGSDAGDAADPALDGQLPVGAGGSNSGGGGGGNSPGPGSMNISLKVLTPHWGGGYARQFLVYIACNQGGLRIELMDALVVYRSWHPRRLLKAPTR